MVWFLIGGCGATADEYVTVVADLPVTATVTLPELMGTACPFWAFADEDIVLVETTDIVRIEAVDEVEHRGDDYAATVALITDPPIAYVTMAGRNPDGHIIAEVAWPLWWEMAPGVGAFPSTVAFDVYAYPVDGSPRRPLTLTVDVELVVEDGSGWSPGECLYYP